MIWDLIQIILLVLLIAVYGLSVYMNKVLLQDSDKMIALQESINASLKGALKKSVETCEFLHRETFELLEMNEALAAERDTYLRRSIMLEDEVCKIKKRLELCEVDLKERL